MKQLASDLRDVEGVKAVKWRDPVLEIDLFSRPIPGSEAVEISGDLRKISQRIRNVLESASEAGVIDGWEWIVKPEKKYQENTPGDLEVSDRKARGHEPGYYRVSVEK
jgi:hypothetical protein